MHPSRKAVWGSAVVAAVAAAGLAAGAREALPLDQIALPAGFHIAVYAADVPNARSMALSPSGVLYVGTRDAGNVYAVVDADRDGTADKVYTIASGLNMPNGVAIPRRRALRGRGRRVLRYDDIDRRLADPPEAGRSCATTSRPSATTAGSSSASAPTAGCTCRSARPATSASPTRATRAISRMKPDGSGLEMFAEGRAQHRGLRLGPRDRRAVVHRQRPRLAGRRPAARRAEPRARARARISASLLPRRRHRGPRLRRQASLLGVHAAGREARPARRVARHALLHREACSRPGTATRSSSPSTAPGTAPRRSATG